MISLCHAAYCIMDNVSAYWRRPYTYWDAGQASARFGMGHPRGVIEIVRQ